MKGNVLELRDLYIGYSDDKNRRIVAHTLNAALPSGVLTCLIGANGVGKSTLLSSPRSEVRYMSRVRVSRSMRLANFRNA